MAQEDEFLRQGRTESIYGATSTRVTSKHRLGEIPFIPDELAEKLPTAEADSANLPEAITLENVDDLIRDIFGGESSGK